MAIEHTYLGIDGLTTDSNFTRSRAIRAKCMDCTCYQSKEIRQCTAKDCSLYPFRMGSVATAQKIEKDEHAQLFEEKV